eukprot:Gb_08653 [translate_table: standard]
MAPLFSPQLLQVCNRRNHVSRDCQLMAFESLMNLLQLHLLLPYLYSLNLIQLSNELQTLSFGLPQFHIPGVHILVTKINLQNPSTKLVQMTISLEAHATPEHATTLVVLVPSGKEPYWRAGVKSVTLHDQGTVEMWEEPHMGIIASITNDNYAIVSCVDDEKPEFQDGDLVVLIEVQGMIELNDGKPRGIKSAKPNCFIHEEDTTNFGVYKKGGIVTKVKPPKVLHLKPLKRKTKHLKILVNLSLVILLSLIAHHYYTWHFKL